MSETISNDEVKPVFEIQKLYVKEQSCKLPYAPDIYKNEWKPEIQIEMNLSNNGIAENIYEVVLRIHLSGKNNQRTAFNLEVYQSGLFKLEGFNSEQLQLLLNGHCPNVLYPYARQVIANMLLESGLPGLQITPINFEAAYQQNKLQQENQTNGEKTDVLSENKNEVVYQ
jgi:preprotein translocase subunit SecB